MAKTKQSTSVTQAEKPAKVVPGAEPRFKTVHIIAAAVAFLLVLTSVIAIFNQSRSLDKVEKLVTSLEQKSTENENRTQALIECVEKVESDLAEQKEKTAPEALEAQFVEYYEKIDKKTNTLIGVVVAAAVLVFIMVLLGGIFLVFRSYKDIERKLDGTQKPASTAKTK